MLRILILLAVLTLGFSRTSLAGFDEGFDAYKKKDWPNAILNLRPQVEKGDAKAMVVLGNMYLDGLGVAMDKHEAFNLYRMASIRNNPDAMVMLAALYQQGLGIDQNPKFAAGWFGRAAQLGHASGAFFYGLHLYRGNRGRAETKFVTAFKPDHEAAYKWFRICAARTTNDKLAAQATKLATNLGAKLGVEKTDIIDKQVKDWAPMSPTDLGPLPEEIPPETVSPEDFPPEKKKEDAVVTPAPEAPAPAPSPVPAPPVTPEVKP